MNTFTKLKFLQRMNRVRGFSLMEIVIGVGIVGILAGIAYPSYTEHVKRSNRSAAQSFLIDISQREAQYLLDSRTYTSSLTNLNLVTPDKVSSLYNITITVGAGNPPTFTATATPKAGTTQASDVTLTINQAGNKTPPEKW